MMTNVFPGQKAVCYEGPLAQLAELRTFNP
jgi:hypothetical protein